MRLWRISDVGMLTKKKLHFLSVRVYDVWMLQRIFGWYLQVIFEARREDSNLMQIIQSASVTFGFLRSGDSTSFVGYFASDVKSVDGIMTNSKFISTLRATVGPLLLTISHNVHVEEENPSGVIMPHCFGICCKDELNGHYSLCTHFSRRI